MKIDDINGLTLMIFQKKLKIYCYYFIISFFCVFCNNIQAEIFKLNNSLQQSRQLNENLQSVINQDQKKYHLPALSVSIQLPTENKIHSYVSGYTNLSKKNIIHSDSLFQMGSITKTFTAVVVLKLAEENKLYLDDKLIKWLPQYPRWGNITIKELLNHTSGVSNYIDTPNFWKDLKKNPSKNWSLTELANIAYGYPNYFQPGKNYHYTNTDYILLGLIVEKITHKKIEKVYNEMIFKPYHLNNTFYTADGYTPAIKARLANGYDNEGTFGWGKDVTYLSTSFASSAGAIVSTPSDIIQFLKLLFSGKILTLQSIDVMTTLISEKNGQALNIKQFLLSKSLVHNPWIDIGDGLGMGLLYFNHSNVVAWVHSGGMPGYQSLYAYDPCTGIYVALAYNIQPKQEFIFLNIMEDLFNVLNKSVLVSQKINTYQRNHVLPVFCYINLSIKGRRDFIGKKKPD